MTDAELIESFRRGDSASFETLYYRHRDWIVTLAGRYCRNREDTFDVLQETFAYFVRKLPDFELRSQFRTFLYPVVKHLALDRRRRDIPMEIPDRAAPPEAEKAELDLKDVPETHREVVLMRFVDGLDLKEIAEALEIPVGTVKSRLHAALEILRRNEPLGPANS